MSSNVEPAAVATQQIEPPPGTDGAGPPNADSAHVGATAGVVRASARQLLLSTVVALLAAALILLTVVLPAEYGIDPSGAGKLLGLTRIGQLKALGDGSGGAVMHEHPRKHLSARIEIRLEGGAELEYKARLDKGEPLLYAWSVRGSTVHFEFHGEPTQGRWPKDFYQSYQTADRSTGTQGSFVAPFTGQHGWYWRN